MSSWIIWSRFIRERTVREIPDALLTEYRFWILLYICFIYLYAIKNLIKPKNNNIILEEFVKVLYKPLKTLDHAIKYNKYVKPYYYKLMLNVVPFFEKNSSDKYLLILFFCMQILPRIFLITFLLLDTFYFHKIELFYKVLLIGLIPFIFRYFIYTIKDIFECWIIELELHYDFVTIYEEGYKFDKSRIDNTEAIHHYTKKTIREYIEIKFENTLCYLCDEITYEYNAYPFWNDAEEKKHFYGKYKTTDNTFIATHFGSHDIETLTKLYYELMPQLLDLRMLKYGMDFTETRPLIKATKIVIFVFYFICWSYILYLSYKYYPVELIGAKNLLINFLRYLISVDNPFSELYWGSLNENLITEDNIKELFKNLLEAIKEKLENGKKT